MCLQRRWPYRISIFVSFHIFHDLLLCHGIARLIQDTHTYMFTSSLLIDEKMQKQFSCITFNLCSSHILCCLPSFIMHSLLLFVCVSVAIFSSSWLDFRTLKYFILYGIDRSTITITQSIFEAANHSHLHVLMAFVFTCWNCIGFCKTSQLTFYFFYLFAVLFDRDARKTACVHTNNFSRAPRISLLARS